MATQDAVSTMWLQARGLEELDVYVIADAIRHACPGVSPAALASDPLAADTVSHLKRRILQTSTAAWRRFCGIMSAELKAQAHATWNSELTAQSLAHSLPVPHYSAHRLAGYTVSWSAAACHQHMLKGSSIFYPVDAADECESSRSLASDSLLISLLPLATVVTQLQAPTVVVDAMQTIKQEYYGRTLSAALQSSTALVLLGPPLRRADTEAWSTHTEDSDSACPYLIIWHLQIRNDLGVPVIACASRATGTNDFMFRGCFPTASLGWLEAVLTEILYPLVEVQSQVAQVVAGLIARFPTMAQCISREIIPRLLSCHANQISPVASADLAAATMQLSFHAGIEPLGPGDILGFVGVNADPSERMEEVEARFQPLFSHLPTEDILASASARLASQFNVLIAATIASIRRLNPRMAIPGIWCEAPSVKNQSYSLCLPVLMCPLFVSGCETSFAVCLVPEIHPLSSLLLYRPFKLLAPFEAALCARLVQPVQETWLMQLIAHAIVPLEPVVDLLPHVSSLGLPFLQQLRSPFTCQGKHTHDESNLVPTPDFPGCLAFEFHMRASPAMVPDVTAEPCTIPAQSNSITDEGDTIITAPKANTSTYATLAASASLLAKEEEQKTELPVISSADAVPHPQIASVPRSDLHPTVVINGRTFKMPMHGSVTDWKTDAGTFFTITVPKSDHAKLATAMRTVWRSESNDRRLRASDKETVLSFMISQYELIHDPYDNGDYEPRDCVSLPVLFWIDVTTDKKSGFTVFNAVGLSSEAECSVHSGNPVAMDHSDSAGNTTASNGGQLDAPGDTHGTVNTSASNKPRMTITSYPDNRTSGLVGVPLATDASLEDMDGFETVPVGKRRGR
jgi:hypothetical protein